MRKLALTLSTLGFVAFCGIANADQKSESSEKVDSGTTLTGKHRTTRTKKVENADGSGIETKTETVTPKNVDKAERTDVRDRADRTEVRDRADRTDVRDHAARPVRDDGTAQVTEKTEHHTTLTGKHQMKTTKKVENADGSQTETTTTKTEPDKK